MIKFLLVLTMVSAIGAAGCTITRKQADDAKKTGGAVVGLFGLPPVVGESIVAGVLAVFTTVAHKNGRRVERKCARPHVPPVTRPTIHGTGAP